MDLDADPNLLFSVDDDEALVGINIPEAMDDLADGADAPMPLDGEDGFGANDNFEVFFEQQAEDEPPSEKRRRVAAAGDGEAEGEEDAPEQFRFADDDGAAAAAEGARAAEDDLMMADGGFGAEPAGPMPSFDEPFDEPFDEGMDEPLDMVGVMANDVGAHSQQDGAAAAPAEAAAARGAPKRTKRKMVLDESIQLSTEQIRAQLADTSKITRNVADGTEPGSAAAEAAEDVFGPPSLPFLPAAAASMSFFFQLHGKDGARGKRPRAAGADDDVEAWRRDDENADPTLAGPPSARKSPRSKSPGGAPEFAELGADGFDEPFGDDEPLGEDEELLPPPAYDDGEPLPTGFAATSELPDVDGGEALEAAQLSKGGKDSQSQSQSQGNHDPATWNPRTRKMYAMLASAFEESGGETLSYNAMIAKTKAGPEKRRVVAGCFQELLFLCTHGLIDLQQKKPFSNILIAQTEHFELAGAH